MISPEVCDALGGNGELRFVMKYLKPDANRRMYAVLYVYGHSPITPHMEKRLKELSTQVYAVEGFHCLIVTPVTNG